MAQSDVPPWSPVKTKFFDENSGIIRTGANINFHDLDEGLKRFTSDIFNTISFFSCLSNT